jgi:NifU-like protein involved in Fe-S cluster formation
MFEYSEKVMEHFKNPKNAGVIEDETASARLAIPHAATS